MLRTLSTPVHPLLGSIRSVRTERPLVALTFDDGPSEDHTEAILDVLSSHGATATFFLLARRAAAFPEIVAAIRDRGHEVGLHGDDHSPLVGCSTRKKIDNIRGGKKSLETSLGAPIRLTRPPYGVQDLRAFVIARTAGLEVIGWTAEGEDWLDVSPCEVADRADAELRPGAILLLHDRCEPSPSGHQSPATNLDRAEMSEQVLRRAANRGLQLVSVGTLLRAGVPDRRPWFWQLEEAYLPP